MHSLNQRWGDEWEAESPGGHRPEAELYVEQEPDPAQDPIPIAAVPAEAPVRDDLPFALPRPSLADSERSITEVTGESAADFRQEPAAPRQALPTRTRRWAVTAALLACALLMSLAYDWHERGRARTLTRELISQQQAMSAALSQARSQIDALSAKVSSLKTPLPAQPAKVPAALPLVATRPRDIARWRSIKEDPSWKQMQDQINAQQREIDRAAELRAGSHGTRKQPEFYKRRAGRLDRQDSRRAGGARKKGRTQLLRV
jgi:hypothetical protein